MKPSPGRPPADPTGAADAVLSIRIPQPRKDAFAAASKRAGLSMSAWILAACIRELTREDSGVARRGPSRPRKTRNPAESTQSG